MKRSKKLHKKSVEKLEMIQRILATPTFMNTTGFMMPKTISCTNVKQDKPRYDVNDAIKILSIKGCRIIGMQIDISKARQLGNGSWGKLDYLDGMGYSITNRGSYTKQFNRTTETEPIIIRNPAITNEVRRFLI